MRGRVGNTSYYYLNGQQVARQARNNSNYGDEARRTEAQQTRRALWGNLVNLYKACSLWMPKAFETKERNQSDYNKFMSVNLNSSEVYLTKDEVSQGCAVVDEYIISQGSLAPVQYVDMTGIQGKSTDILCAGVTLNTATLGAISQAIIAQNAAYRDKDNIAFIIFENWADGTTYPYVATRYLELTLDVSSTDAFSGHPLSGYLDISEDNDALEVATYVNVTARAVGWACIHTRQDGILKVSSQAIALQKPIIKDNYISLVAKQAAIDSYGVDEQVPLEPSFKKAVIDSVAIDGSEVLGPEGGNLSYNRAVLLTIKGSDLSNGNVQLVHDGVVYTPLSVSADSRDYTLGANGVNIIYVNGFIFARITISGIVVPEGLPTLMEASLFKPTEPAESRDKVTYPAVDCANYPHMVQGSFSSFLLYIGSDELPFDSVRDDFVTVGCNITFFSSTGWRARIVVEPSSETEVCYITFKGFIVFVANYTV